MTCEKSTMKKRDFSPENYLEYKKTGWDNKRPSKKNG